MIHTVQKIIPTLLAGLFHSVYYPCFGLIQLTEEKLLGARRYVIVWVVEILIRAIPKFGRTLRSGDSRNSVCNTITSVIHQLRVVASISFSGESRAVGANW